MRVAHDAVGSRAEQVDGASLLAPAQRVGELVARQRQLPLADQRVELLWVALERLGEGCLGLAIQHRVGGLADALKLRQAELGIGLSIVWVLADALLQARDRALVV